MKKMIWLIALFLILLLPLVGCTGEPSGQPVASSPVTLKPTISPSPIPTLEPGYNPFDFEESLKQVKGYSTSVEIVWYTTGNQVLLNRDDPKYAEFIHLFNLSIIGQRISRLDKTVENDKTPTVSRSVPYAQGYILTFTLRDNSKLWFNCSGENIWYESEDTIYQGSFDAEFRTFLEEILKTTSGNRSLSGITFQPEPGQYLYYDSRLSAGTVLKSVSVRPGGLDQDYMDLTNRGQLIFKKGDPCLLVTGQIESQLDQDKYMTMVARGYDASGQEVAHVLDHGPIQGVISIFLPAKGFGGFIIHLNAAPDVVRIELTPSPELYDIPPP